MEAPENLGLRPANLVERLKCEYCKTREVYQGSEDDRWCAKCVRMMRRAGMAVHSQVPRTSRFLAGIIPKRYQDALQDTIPEACWKAYESLADDRGLYLWGAPGVGKTWMACGFLQALWWQGWEVNRVTWDQLTLGVRSTYQRDSKTSEQEYLKDLMGVDKLLIEDIGCTVSNDKQESDFAVRVCLMIIDSRLDNMKATYMTSNKPIELIEQTFDARIASRIHQACEIIKIGGKDRRQRHESEKNQTSTQA